jgi:hypothetical protein
MTTAIVSSQNTEVGVWDDLIDQTQNDILKSRVSIKSRNAALLLLKSLHKLSELTDFVLATFGAKVLGFRHTPNQMGHV